MFLNSWLEVNYDRMNVEFIHFVANTETGKCELEFRRVGSSKLETIADLIKEKCPNGAQDHFEVLVVADRYRVQVPKSLNVAEIEFYLLDGNSDMLTIRAQAVEIMCSPVHQYFNGSQKGNVPQLVADVHIYGLM